MLNITQIPAPRVPFLDPQTNMVSPQWFLWFNNLYSITGNGTGVTPVINGGTGLGTIPINGQLLIGNGTGYSLNTLFAGAGISVSNGAGVISLANTGVLSNIAGTGITVSSATGDVTVAIDNTVVTLTGTQTLQNKTLDKTNTVTLLDTLFTLQDNLDNTKQAQFQLSTIGSGVTRTYTLQNQSGTIALLSGAQTFTGVNTFSNATISVGSSTATGTMQFAYGATLSGNTKTVEIATNGVSGSTTAITIGSTFGTTGNVYGNWTFNTPISVASGGTGQTSYAVGDLLYANTTTTLAKLADVATGNAIISGGVGVAPSYGKIGLTTHVSGTLPTANGGTNLTSFTANGIVYASSASVLATASGLTFDGTTLKVNSGTTNATTYNTAALTGGSLLTLQQQKTTSVSTTATVILTPGQYGSFLLVFGTDGTNRFMDVILFGLATGTVNVISSLAVDGTPASRTYTQAFSTWRLAMASGVYTVQAAALSMSD